MPATRSPSFAIRWRGPQPVRAHAEPEFSSAVKNAWDINGLYEDIKLQHESYAKLDEPNPEPPFPAIWPTRGLAQASHSSAGIWLTEETASREMSEDCIDRLNRS